MSNYTKATNFTLKDGLSTGDPQKIIKGADIDAEYNAIASAVASKADLNSPTFTGTPNAPTASTGTSSTQIASTAFVQSALIGAYPIGSIYMNATVATNPATLLGFGTWVAFGAGKVPVGIDATDTDFDVIKETVGTKTHTLTTSEIPSHTHTFSYTQTPSSALANTQVHPISADGGSNPDYNVIGTKTTDANKSLKTDANCAH